MGLRNTPQRMGVCAPKRLRLAVVVPTRNRADLALNAVRSLLKCAERSFEVLLSDNSTLSLHTEQLTHFVECTPDERLLLLRPPTAMSMTRHWDWAVEAALARPLTSHVVVLTDRMMFKHGCLDSLLAIIAQHPEQIVSYDHDRVVDHRTPITVDLAAWSDEVIQLSSERLLALSSRCIFVPALPRLLNSAVPRAVLEDVRNRFGTIVGSSSPDYSFCYRSLALVDNIAYWDRAPIVHYALAQSNGESSARGVQTAASVDFVETIEGTMFASAPCPGVRTVRNAILHEYFVVSEESSSTKFPTIDVDTYASMLHSEIEAMENRELATEMTARLEVWLSSAAVQKQRLGRGGSLRRLARRWGIGSLLLWVRQKVTGATLQQPSQEQRASREFAEANDALDYAMASNGERLPAMRLAFMLSR